MQIHFGCHYGVKKDKTQVSDITEELFVMHLGLFGVITVDQGRPNFCINQN